MSNDSLADLLDDILAALKNAVDCTSCQALLVPLQTLAHLGNDPFVQTFTEICEALKLQDDDVCAGTFNLTGPVLAHSLRQFTVGGTTAVKFCTVTFGLCTQPPVQLFNVSFPKPAPQYPKQFKSQRRVPFQVIHISDVHIDRQYTVGSDANCTKNICCRNFADKTGPVTEPAGPFGNHKCDSPPALADSLLSAMNELGSRAKFSLFTGDVIEGATWLVDKAEGETDLKAWNAQMAAKVGAPVFGAIGIDSAPVNGFPRNDTITSLNAQWVFDTQSAGWKRWIHWQAANQLDHISGSYSVVMKDLNLRFWLYDTDNMPADPNGIMAFIVDQLQAAEDAGERAWLFGHIPLGKADIFHDQSNYLDQIVQRYKHTIAAHFYGHSHKDEFEIAYSDYDNQTAETADSIAFIGPALTPTSGNPAFKLYDIDPDTLEVMDMKVFITNTSDPNFQTKPTWQFYYSARESYGPLTTPPLAGSSPLDAAFWHRLTEVFESNNTAFQLFNERLSRGGDVQPCDDEGGCRNTTICDMRALRSQNNCDVPGPGFALKRDTIFQRHRTSERMECEGSNVAATLGSLISGAVPGDINEMVKQRIRGAITLGAFGSPS
ncbi:sphingomyelin phosphodiesterase [Hysterangium stoloniferum]|nr:sphingomyelin phosphodiesterase [Hysterangium stoloniferum]